MVAGVLSARAINPFLILTNSYLSLQIPSKMPSESAKRRKEKKRAQGKGKSAAANGNAATNGISTNGVTNEMNNLKISNRACTGVLASHPEARDLHIHQFSITFHGVELLLDTKLEVNTGRRYGLIGKNGCGKYLSPGQTTQQS